MNKRITFRPTVNDDICSFEFSIDGKVAGCIYNEANDVSKENAQKYMDLISRSVDMHKSLTTALRVLYNAYMRILKNIPHNDEARNIQQEIQELLKEAEQKNNQ